MKKKFSIKYLVGLFLLIVFIYMWSDGVFTRFPNMNVEEIFLVIIPYIMKVAIVFIALIAVEKMIEEMR